MEIKVKELFGETVGDKESIRKIEELIGNSREAVINFSGVYFMSKEPAKEYLEMKRRVRTKIIEDKMNDDLKQTLEVMQNV